MSGLILVQTVCKGYQQRALVGRELNISVNMGKFTLCIEENCVNKNIDSPSFTRLPNARMLNIWLNIKNNCSMKKIKNRGMSCNSLWISAFVV